MATSPAAPSSSEADKGSLAARLPDKWWQWVIIYPTLALSLISAVPKWADSARGWWIGVVSYTDAMRANELWTKNASCVGLNSKGMMAPSKVAVDATICNSGDILVHAMTQQNKEVFKWLPLDDVVRPARGWAGFVPAAQAATMPVAGVQQGNAAASFATTVICARNDGRYLHRRVSTPEGCFDEVIDTFTGALMSRKSAPCDPQC